MSDFHRQQEPVHNDEIDVRSFFRSIGRGLANLGRKLIAFAALLRRTSIRHKWMLVILFIVGAIAGIGVAYLNKDSYVSSMMLRSSLFTDEIVNNYINRLDGLTDSPQRLAAELEITSEEASTIDGFSVQPVYDDVSLEFQNMVKKRLQTDIENDPSLVDLIDNMTTGDTYIVHVRGVDTEVIKSLDDKLLAHFRNSPYFIKRIELNERNEKLLSERLEKDIASLDSLKSAIIKSIQANPSGQASSYVLTDNRIDESRFSTLFQDADYLYQKKIEADVEAEVETIEVIQSFGNYAEIYSVSKPVYALVGGFILLGIGYLILLLKGLNQYLIRYDRDRNHTL